MNTEYMARALISRMYEVDDKTESASEYLNKRNPADNYLDRAESIMRYALGRFEKILKQEHPKPGYDGAKADEGDISFSNKIIRDSLYTGRN